MQNRRQFLSSTVAIVATIAVATIALTPGLVVAQDTDWAVKMFEKQTHDFGVVARGSDTTYRLKLKNIYEQEVHISEVTTTCGCSAGKPGQETLKSLEETYVEITMDTRKFMRRKDSNVIVTFDKPIYGRVQIPITAYIRTDVVIEPGSAQFGTVDREEKNEKTLKIAYAGRQDWKIEKVETGNKFIEAKAVETSREAGYANYDLTVTLDPETPYGPLRHFITLVTDDKDNPKIPLLVEADVKPDIVVYPAIVSLGTMSPGEKKTVNVVLKGKKPFEVSGVTCEKAEDVFAVRLPTTASLVHSIPLTITAPDKAGKLDEELRIKIPGRKEPVTFRAYGQVSASGT